MRVESLEHVGDVYESEHAPPIDPRHTHRSLTDKISELLLQRPISWWWILATAAAFALLLVLLVSVGYLLLAGVGIWGVNVPSSWGIAITNFIWWIGIAHAGTLISASLILMRQSWRNSISRFAEGMTVFAVICAALFPLLHLGRPYYFYWLLPYPNTIGIGPQFRSALVWDVIAILAYMIVSVLFWYVGMLPDLATVRDRAQSRWVGATFSVLALGWRGDTRHWHRYHVTYVLLAGLATALVVSPHSIVALDFAVTIVPGWHSTVLPPYFVAGATLSGFAMASVLGMPLRAIYGLHDVITEQHVDNLGKLLLATSFAVGYGYLTLFFLEWYSGSLEGWYAALAGYHGHYVVMHWVILVCNLVVPLVLFSRWIRTSPLALWLVSVIVLVGMWLERYAFVLASLERDYLPSAWGRYSPTFWDWALFAGSFGLFFSLFFLFLRLLPIVSMFETRQLLQIARRYATKRAEKST